MNNVELSCILYLNRSPVSSVKAKKFTGLFEGVPASIAFVFTKSACVQLSLQAWDLCPQIRACKDSALGPYAA